MRTPNTRDAIAIFAIWTLVLAGSFVPVRADDSVAPIFPFVISYDGPDNASSVTHLLDAPAGKHGFVRVKDGRFATDAGPIRFHATNLTGPANFPAHEAADKLAERLARFGINCVRLHFMDTWYVNFMPQPTQAILADDTHTQRNLDPKQLDKLDYMIAAFKKRGVYVNVNLHVGRTLDQRDGFENSAGLPWANKGIGQFVPRMIELQKEYAQRLLTHVNPYTGNAYTDEPCVAMIEISNEDSLTRHYYDGTLDRLPDPYATELRRQWNAWLHATYADGAALQNAWKWRREPLHDEQIPDGAFDSPIALDGQAWRFEKGSGAGDARTEGGVLKVDVRQDGGEFFAKVIRKLAVKKGQLYTLSFKIRRMEGTGPWDLSVAVATVQGGWRSLGLQDLVRVGDSWKTVTRVFEATEDVQQAHLQLTRFKVGRYELDDLSFQAGAEISCDPRQGFAEHAVPSVRIGEGVYSAQARRDFVRFLFDTETSYWTGMADFVKGKLKARQPISGTQLGYSPADIQARLDYVDSHAYWRHPTGGWISLTATEPWAIGNDAMVNSLGNILRLAGQRVLHKPYTVSEYNHPYPNQYGAEGQATLAVYGRLQGWDGIFQYSYNHYVDDFAPQANPWCFFDLLARTDVLAHYPACAAIFLRGDVQEAKQSLVASIGLAACREKLIASRSNTFSIGSLGHDARLVAVHKTAVAFVADDGELGPGSESQRSNGEPIEVQKFPADQKVFVSDTGEITWNTEKPDAAYLAVNAPNTKLFTGFPEGRTIDLGSVKLAIGKTRLNWATVSLVSRHATGFGENGEPASILLAATGDSGNAGRVVKQLDGKRITLTDRGGPPVLAEGISAVLTLAADPVKVRCYALDPRGDRKSEVPVDKAESGAKIAIGPEYKTVWYEIEVR
jgi:hypothetical protein